MPSRHQRLGDPWADFIAREARYAIALTIQPNFGWSDDATGSTRVRDLTKGVFYRLLYTGCPQPQWLPHDQRFNGFVVVEKRNASPHIHMLIPCHSAMEQAFGSTFLLEVADNTIAPRKDPLDDAWQRTTREFIKRHPWSGRHSWAPNESVVTQLAPAATIRVRRASTEKDVRRWAGYMTKAWRYSSSQLADRRSIAVDDGALEWFELLDFFPGAPSHAATPWKADRTGSQTLDLDDLRWRRPSRGILK